MMDMTKYYAKNLCEKYGMEILREPVTQEAWALYLKSNKAIPELDELWLAKEPTGMEVQVTPDGTICYCLRCPKQWFDLWGFKI